MYGPHQHWDQWDASCFNLAPEPGRSRSGASWKSDGTGLSPPPCTPCPPPTPLLPCARLINTFLPLVSIWSPRRGELTFRWTEDVLHRYPASESYRASYAPPPQGSCAGQRNPFWSTSGLIQISPIDGSPMRDGLKAWISLFWRLPSPSVSHHLSPFSSLPLHHLFLRVSVEVLWERLHAELTWWAEVIKARTKESSGGEEG